MIERDPAYRAEVAAKGGAWFVGFPPDTMPEVLAAVSSSPHGEAVA